MSLTIVLGAYTLPAPAEYSVTPRISGNLRRRADGSYSFAQHGSNAAPYHFEMSFRGLSHTEAANAIAAWKAALSANVTLTWVDSQNYTVRAQSPEPTRKPDGVGTERVDGLHLVEV